MKYTILALAISSIALSGCKQPDSPSSADVRQTIDALKLASATPKGGACWSDAECEPDEDCYCAESDSGNCTSVGVCLPRGNATEAAKAEEARRAGEAMFAALAATQKTKSVPAAIAEPAITSCRPMSGVSFIPQGYHPTTAQWALQNNQINDLVCIAPTRGSQIRVLRWMDYPLPQGYYTLYTQDAGVDSTFRGCRQWTSWQGQNTCINSWTLHVMQKNPD